MLKKRRLEQRDQRLGPPTRDGVRVPATSLFSTPHIQCSHSTSLKTASNLQATPHTMAEAIGLAASVAGLVELAGQLGSGCMKVKGFLDDTKDAPADIRDLHTAMGILAKEAERVSTLFTKSNQPPVVKDEYETALKQCDDAVTALSQKIEKAVKRFGGGEGKWWDRMKAATRKKKLAEQVSKVERAKTQLTLVMQELSMYVSTLPLVSLREFLLTC